MLQQVAMMVLVLSAVARMLLPATTMRLLAVRTSLVRLVDAQIILHVTTMRQPVAMMVHVRSEVALMQRHVTTMLLRAAMMVHVHSEVALMLLHVTTLQLRAVTMALAPILVVPTQQRSTITRMPDVRMVHAYTPARRVVPMLPLVTMML
jgi:hypothetical protein